MSGVAAMPTCRCVADNEIGAAGHSGAHLVWSEVAAWTQAGQRHSCSTTDGRA
jgi:hypothetical protein